MQEPLSAINDRVAQAIYIQQLAERIGIAESAVLESVTSLGRQKSQLIRLGFKGCNAGRRIAKDRIGGVCGRGGRVAGYQCR